MSAASSAIGNRTSKTSSTIYPATTTKIRTRIKRTSSKMKTKRRTTMSPSEASHAASERRLNAGKPPVVRDTGAGLAGRSPARLVPPQPRAAGVPGSSDAPSANRTARITAGIARAIEMRANEKARQARIGGQLDDALRDIDLGKIHSEHRDPVFDRYPLPIQNDLKSEYIARA